jgi:hypothetical protein
VFKEQQCRHCLHREPLRNRRCLVHVDFDEFELSGAFSRELLQRRTHHAARSTPGRPQVDKNPRLAQRFEVQAVPTLLVLDKGQTIARQAGAAPAPALRRWVEQSITAREG